MASMPSSTCTTMRAGASTWVSTSIWRARPTCQSMRAPPTPCWRQAGSTPPEQNARSTMRSPRWMRTNPNARSVPSASQPPMALQWWLAS